MGFSGAGHLDHGGLSLGKLQAPLQCADKEEPPRQNGQVIKTVQCEGDADIFVNKKEKDPGKSSCMHRLDSKRLYFKHTITTQKKKNQNTHNPKPETREQITER